MAMPRSLVGWGWSRSDSNVYMYVYLPPSAPNATLNVTVTSINGSTILLSWKPLSPVEARGFVRYYLVTWTPGTSGTIGSTGGGTATLTADTTTFLITDLNQGYTNFISIHAGTCAGLGPPSVYMMLQASNGMLC